GVWWVWCREGGPVGGGSIDGIALWRLRDNSLSPEAEPTLPHRFVHALAFSPDGRTLAIADNGDGRVRLWPVAGGPGEWLDGSDEYQVRGLQFSPTTRTLNALTTDCEVLLLRPGEGRASVARLRVPSARQAAFSPDGGRVLIAHTDGTARLATIPGRTTDD